MATREPGIQKIQGIKGTYYLMRDAQEVVARMELSGIPFNRDGHALQISQ